MSENVPEPHHHGEEPQSRTQSAPQQNLYADVAAPNQEDPVATASTDPLGTDVKCYDLEYLMYHRNGIRRSYRQHNAALKWFRELLQHSDEHAVVFPNIDLDLPACVHEHGMNYNWNYDDMQQWCWLDCVSQLTCASMKILVQGTENRSRGIVQCAIAHTDKDDYKRHHAMKTMGVDTSRMIFREWHFISTRDDGSTCALRPNWSNTRVQLYTAVKQSEETHANNWGGRKEPGTYKYFKMHGVDQHLRFDESLQPWRGAG